MCQNRKKLDLRVLTCMEFEDCKVAIEPNHRADYCVEGVVVMVEVGV